MLELKAGDLVVVHKPDRRDGNPSWPIDMDYLDGKVVTVAYLRSGEELGDLWFDVAEEPEERPAYRFAWTISSKWCTPIDLDLSKWITPTGKALSIAKMKPEQLRNAIVYLDMRDSGYWQASKIISLNKALAKFEGDRV